jgi:hypothetical protein
MDCRIKSGNDESVRRDWPSVISNIEMTPLTIHAILHKQSAPLRGQ